MGAQSSVSVWPGRDVKRLMLAVVAVLAACSPVTPSGEPVVLYTHPGDCYDHFQWVEGKLLPDPGAGTDIDVTAITDPTDPSLTVDGVAWGSSGNTSPPRIVPLQWPVGFTGVRLAEGQIAVVDPTGNLVALTGHTYAFKGASVIEIYALGNAAPPGWVSEFNVCRDRGSVIAK